MKTLTILVLVAGLGWPAVDRGWAQAPEPSPNETERRAEPVPEPPAVVPPVVEPPEAPPAESGNGAAPESASEPVPIQDPPAASAAPGSEATLTPGTPEPAVELPQAASVVPVQPKPRVITPSTNSGEVAAASPLAPGQIRMNFRGAPLDMVLNHLSEAAGFIIVMETEVSGKVDAWSNQPLSTEEAIELVGSVLAKQGCTVLRNGRTLTIVSRDEAKKRDIPVKMGNDPADIPKNEEIVTQIIPVRYISATALVRDLQPLLPAQATLTANEGGNALVMTDTQTNIRRMAEIIRALDTAIASVSSVRVFPLKYADAKSLATIVKELFQTDATRQNQAQGQGRFMNFMRGGGGQGGVPGMPGGAVDPSGGRAPAQKVVAVADERSNALVVSAPEDQMPIVEDLVNRIDTNVEDVTELRVFRLKYSDPQEMADLLTSLFPDSSTSQGGRGSVQFGGRFGGMNGGQAGATAASSRMQKQTRVLAVPDARTRSVIVSAARELLEQIAPMITQLDADSSKNQKVHVFSVENADASSVETLLKGLFEGQNSRNRNTSTRNSAQQPGNQLNSRASQNQNQRTTTSTLGGNNAFGGNR